MKKTISGLLALFLLLSLCAGCGNTDAAPDQSNESGQTDLSGVTDQTAAPTPAREGSIYNNLLGIDPSEAVLTTKGNSIPAELYLYWLTYACSNLEYQLNMYSAYYGLYSELLNEDGTAKWDGDLEGTPLIQMVKEQAEITALSYAVLENVAAAHGVTLTDEDKAALESDLAAYIEQLGGEEAFENSLWEMGVSLESFNRISATTFLYQHLLELAQDPDSDLYQAPTNDDAYVDHILLMTKDSTTNEPLSDEEIEAKKAKAEELLAQLQAADPADLEALFTQLAEENGEDPGRASEAGYLINPDTNFVQEFKDAAFALQPGQLSGIVESDYGYHILLRKELTESQRATVSAQNLSNYLDEQMEDAQASVIRSEQLDNIDVGAFYNSYREIINALYAQEAADAAGGEDGGDAPAIG